jgi:hypothetical protein
MNLINITPASSTTFDIDLGRGRYTFTFVYNPRIELWTITLSQAGVVLVRGQAAVMGAELFRGHANPLIPRGLYFAPLGQSTLDATYKELGARVVLVQLVAEDGINV